MKYKVGDVVDYSGLHIYICEVSSKTYFSYCIHNVNHMYHCSRVNVDKHGKLLTSILREE